MRQLGTEILDFINSISPQEIRRNRQLRLKIGELLSSLQWVERERQARSRIVERYLAPRMLLKHIDQ